MEPTFYYHHAMLTLDDVDDWIDGNLGGCPRELVLRYANEAGNFLTSAYAWRFLEGREATLDAVISQDYLSLPADFSDITSEVYSKLTVRRDFVLTTQELFQREKERSVTLTGYTYGTLITDDDADGIPEDRIEIHPIPTASESSRWSVRYRATWKPITEDETVLRLPVWMEGLYLELLEAIVRGHEEYDEGTVSQRLVGFPKWEAYRVATKRNDRRRRRAGPVPLGRIGKIRRRNSFSEQADVSSPYNGPVSL